MLGGYQDIINKFKHANSKYSNLRMVMVVPIKTGSTYRKLEKSVRVICNLIRPTPTDGKFSSTITHKFTLT